MTERYEAPKVGSKEYYDQDPRSSILRRISLEMTAHYRRVVLSEGITGPAMARLLELNQELAILGIASERMHEDTWQHDFTDPVVRAERFTSFLRYDLQAGYGLSEEVQSFLRGEVAEAAVNPGQPIEVTHDGPDAFHSFAGQVAMTIGTLGELDYIDQWFDVRPEEQAPFSFIE